MSQLINKYQSLKQASQAAIRESQSLEQTVDCVLTGIVHDTIKRYQDKVAAGIEDSISDVLDNFKHKVTEAIFRTASTWKVENRQPVMFPQGCRFAYTRGSSTIFVIEQPLGVRSVLFDSGVIEREFDEDSYQVGSSRFSLAMPYVVFVLHFKHDTYSGLYCGWRNAPLKSLNDLLSKPVLPNVHDGLSVCMTHTRGAGDTFSDACESAISHFWNSKFNNDLSDGWWNKSNIDARFTTVAAWEHASEEDPMWVLNIEYPNQRALQSVIDLLVMHESDPDEHEFRHNLAESIDDSVGYLFSRITRYVKKTKFEKYYPKDVTDPLRDAIIQTVDELVDLIHLIDKEMSDLSSEIKEPKKKSVKSGMYWTEYTP